MFLLLKKLKICCSSYWQIALSSFQCVSFSAFRSSLQYVSVLIVTQTVTPIVNSCDFTCCALS